MDTLFTTNASARSERESLLALDAGLLEGVDSAVVSNLQLNGRGTLADYCGNMVLYRNLRPLDKRLPNTRLALREAGLSPEDKPRKQDPAYAKIALWYAEAAHQLAGQSGTLGELLFVGDTLYNDGGAFRNMAEQCGWPSACFIGVEAAGEAPAHSIEHGIYQANRWEAIAEWTRWLRQDQGFQLGENTVAIVDIDKTALGAKGRNDKVIDRARIEGAYHTMTALLGPDFDIAPFVATYTQLNRSAYHPLTEDNQDYLAYICLAIVSGLLSFEELTQQVQDGCLKNFDQFTRLVETRMLLNTTRSEGVRQAHDAVVTSVRNGDPTPFKRFRRQEFAATIQHMGQMSDDTPLAEMLVSEIVLTEEVCALMAWLRNRGCVVMCLSDKPDEASVPDPRHTPDLPPVHMAETHRVGVNIRPLLDQLA